MHEPDSTPKTDAQAPVFPLRADGKPRSPIARWLIGNTDHAEIACLIPPFKTRPDGRLRMRFAGGTTYASRIMCWLRHGPPPTPLHVAAHRCGNGHEACANPSHLYWATRRENMLDKNAHGTMIRGVDHPVSKLNEVIVIDMRRRYKNGEQQKDLAAEYGVARSVACEAINGITWGHVT